MIINPLYKWGAIAIAAALVAGVFMWQRSTISNLKEEVELHKAAVQGYEQAQIVNLGVIEELRLKNNQCVESKRIGLEAAAAAVAAADAEERKTAKQLATTSEELARVYAKHPSARAWGNSGVDSAVLGSLPNRARPN